MPRKIYDGAVVRCSITDELYEVLQVQGGKEGTILVSPIDSEFDKNGDLPGEWLPIDDFEIRIPSNAGVMYVPIEGIVGDE